MSVPVNELVDFAEDALVWLGRAVKLLPAIKALWQAIEGNNEGQVFAAQLELTRQMRREQAKAEIAELNAADEPNGDQS